MQLEIRNVADGPSDAIRKNIAAGRTVLSLRGGERIEIVDPITGKVPPGVRVRRGGPSGQDLIVESSDETVELQGFFDMEAEGQEAVMLRLPGAESEEITPATPGLGVSFSGEAGGSVMPVDGGADAWLAPMQGAGGAAAGGGAGASSAGSVAGTSGGGAAASNLGWWVLGGLGGAAVIAAVADDDDDDAPPAPEPEPTLTLSRSAAEVEEGETVTFTVTTTNVPAGTQYNYTISGVSPTDVEGGSLTGTVTIGPDGKAAIPVTIARDGQTEGDETLTLTVAGSSASVVVKDASQAAEPKYTLEVIGDVESVAEGQTVKFRLKTENLPEGQKYTYTIDGVDADDVVGGKLSGDVTIDANGEAVIEVTLKADAATEGNETLTVKVGEQSASVVVEDTSQTAEPKYSLEVIGDVESVTEGQTVKFRLKTENVAEGETYTYTIEGVDAGDVEGGKLSGEVTIDANGEAVIEVTLKADAVAEADETLTVKVVDESASVTVTDATPTYTLSAPEEVNEGEAITFTLTTTNVAAGAQYAYTITGVSDDDVQGGSRSGVVTIGPDGKAEVKVTLLADTATEGNETLTFTLPGLGKSVEVVVRDTSIQQTFELSAGRDTVVGSELSDEITGTDATFSSGDEIEGGAGYDKLNLTLHGRIGAAEGVTVSNVEEVNLSAVEGDPNNNTVKLRMSRFDPSVEQINIEDATADVVIEDQQSKAAVRITDTTNSVTLNYDSQVVNNEDDALSVTIDEFGREGSGTAAVLTIDDRIERLDVHVEDDDDEGSNVELNAEGVTSLTIDGGTEGQRASFKLNLNAGRAEESTLDATDFAGDLDLTGIKGGREKFAFKIEIDAGLEEGQSATITINGQTFTVESGPTDLTAQGLANRFAELLGNSPLGIVAQAQDSGEGADLLVLKNFDFDALGLGLIEAEIAGAAVTIDRDEENTKVKHSTLSDVTLSGGDDLVEVAKGDITYHDVYDLGDGDNELTVKDDLHGTVKFGEGEGQTLVVEDNVGGLANVSFEEGENSVSVVGDVKGFAHLGFAGGRNTVEVEGDIGGYSKLEFADGRNRVVVGEDSSSGGAVTGAASIVFDGDEDNELEAKSITGSATVSFGNGDNDVTVHGEIGENASFTFGTGTNAVTAGSINDDASLQFAGNANIIVNDRVDGASDVAPLNEVRVKIDVAGDADISVGNEEEGGDLAAANVGVGGDADIYVGGGVHSSTIDVGGGADITIGDDVQVESAIHVAGDAAINIGGRVEGSAIHVGGDADTFHIGGSVKDSTIEIEGASTADIGGSVKESDITFGGQADASVGGTVSGGSSIQFAETDDSLELTGDRGWKTLISGKDEATSIEMGAGDDGVHVTDGDNRFNTVVGSGGRLDGGEGADSLTVAALGSIHVAKRTERQETHVKLDGSYEEEDVVAIQIGDDIFEYVIKSSDIVQGEPEQTAFNIAQGLVGVIMDPDDDIEPALEASWDTVAKAIALKGKHGAGHIDVSVGEGSDASFSAMDVQLPDATVEGFETLNLVALDPDRWHGQPKNVTLTADFELITDVEQINLESQVDRREKVFNEDLNGEYTSYRRGDTVTFELKNLPGELDDPITVSGKEVTATGNVQVVEIAISEDEAAHSASDQLTVVIGGQRITLNITGGMLSADDAVEDAAAIAAALAAKINEENDDFNAVADGNNVTLIGTSHENVPVRFGGEWFGHDNDFGDSISVRQWATASDDHEIDVFVDATPAENGPNDVLRLEIDGGDDERGAFDLGITGAGSPAFDHLVLDVNDRHSHFIDTGVGDSENEAFRQSITLTGGDEEATIALNDVVAKSVVANSDANIEIAFDSEADEIHSEDAEGEPVKTAAENFGFTIQTGGGNDVVDMSEVVLTRHASIDLGDGEDRLVITNGNDGADAAITPFLNADGVLSDTDSDQIFKGVRNVEILEFHGDDRLKFNDDASAAGFERLVVGRESSLYLDVLQAFQRDSFAVEIGDRVKFDLDVWNDANYELTAEDRLRARIAFNQEAAGNLKLHADDSAKIKIDQHGTGDVDVIADRNAEVDIEHGSVEGAVGVELGSRSSLAIEYTKANEDDLSIVQTNSNHNAIVLDGLTAGQDVSIDITVFGYGRDTVVADFGTNVTHAFSTNLEVLNSTGGIGTLTLHSKAGLGDPGENPVPNASGNVSVVVADSWAVSDDEDDTFDLTIDAASVVAAKPVQTSTINFLEGAEYLDETVTLTINGVTLVAVVEGDPVEGQVIAGAFAEFLTTGQYDGDPAVTVTGEVDTTGILAEWSSSSDGVLTLTGVSGAAYEVSAHRTFGEGSDLSVVSSEESGFVVINGAAERDADLKLLGSATSRDVLLGGGGSDELVGGDGRDLLQGDNLVRWVIDFPHEMLQGFASNPYVDAAEGDQLVRLEIGDLAFHVVALDGGLEAEGLVTLLANTLKDGDPSADGESGIDAIVIAFNQNVEVGVLQDASGIVNASVRDTVQDLLASEFGEILMLANTEAVGTSLYLDLQPGASMPNVEVKGQTFFEPNQWLDNDYAATMFADCESDVLDGGEGADLYVIGQSQFDTIDTIIGLNLGEHEENPVDMIALGAFLSAGSVSAQDIEEPMQEDDWASSLWSGAPADAIIGTLLQVTKIVNPGVSAEEADSMNSALSLEFAVKALFEQANGPFHVNGEMSKNAAGLFKYGNDTYLIATGDNADGTFGADDFIIKVTGVTGYLDVNDFFFVPAIG